MPFSAVQETSVENARRGSGVDDVAGNSNIWQARPHVLGRRHRAGAGELRQRRDVLVFDVVDEDALECIRRGAVREDGAHAVNAASPHRAPRKYWE